MLKLIIPVLLAAAPTLAQSSPTVVYGASEDAAGKPDQYLLIQPQDSGNPLGNPIVDTQQPENLLPPAAVNSGNTLRQPADIPDNHGNTVNQVRPQDPEPFSENPKQQQNDIENTLYQGGNRIYDVQSFPLQDIKTITEPNIQPTITTYPEY